MGPVCPKSERIHPSIIWTCSIRYDSVRNICAVFFFVLFLHQNLVTVTGNIEGSYSYTSQAGWNISVPLMKTIDITK
ncbi:hypothetical protein EXW28_27765 (plasmid) [Bacillus mycoides]|nr:hypothetical protein EXW37_27755 [Bacillus mycoides]QWG59145.1 hypothetical protein EXW26_27730 [Bacillus mycoides]QWH37383.1 hypothetical protein EXW28_27765 [Bacillus mycoides]